MHLCPYSAAYMSQTRDQNRFTISEVADDWLELMIPRRLTIGPAMHPADLPLPQSATPGLHP